MGEHSRAAKILVVDDEAVIRRTTRSALEKAGYSVEEAAGGRDAWKLVNQWKPDLVLMDAMLPDIHGFHVAKEMRQAGLETPVIVMSAFYGGGGFAEDVKETWGVNAYIEKPFRLPELLKLVERVLSEPVGDTNPS